MTKQFRVSSTLPRKLQELGLSPETALRRAGLPMGLFKLEKILVCTEDFFALHRGIAESSNDPDLGLKLGTEERVERYDPVKIAAISARSFRDAVERLSRYKQLTCPEEIRVVERGNESAVQFVWLLAHEKEPPLLVDVCFAWIVAMAHRGIGRPLSPKRVEFQRAPAHRQMYERHFRCAVKFKADQNKLIFSKGDMELPFVTHNADLLATVAPQLEAELTEQLAHETFTEQAKGTPNPHSAMSCTSRSYFGSPRVLVSCTTMVRALPQDKRRFLTEARATPQPIFGLMTNSSTVTLESST